METGDIFDRVGVRSPHLMLTAKPRMARCLSGSRAELSAKYRRNTKESAS